MREYQDRSYTSGLVDGCDRLDPAFDGWALEFDRHHVALGAMSAVHALAHVINLDLRR